eukprot:8731727-Karenia_brevis.AAC.1
MDFIGIFTLGVPCSTWGPAGWLNRGTRRKGREEGDGTLHREIIANELVTFVCFLCDLLISAGGFFSIENPYNSHIWKFRAVDKLCEGG